MKVASGKIKEKETALHAVKQTNDAIGFLNVEFRKMWMS